MGLSMVEMQHVSYQGRGQNRKSKSTRHQARGTITSKDIVCEALKTEVQ